MMARQGLFKRIFRRSAVQKRREKLHELDVKMRSEGSRQARLKGLMSLALVLFGFAILLAGFRYGVNWAVRQLMQENPSFTIDKVEIEGARMLGGEVVRNWAGVAEGLNLFNVDVARVRRDLEMVPFIEAATVERVLPRRLKLTIVERTPVARVCIYRPSSSMDEVQTANLFLDARGYVMPARGPFSEVAGAENQAMLARLPVLTGIRADTLHSGLRVETPQVQAALRLINDFESSGLQKRLSLQSVDVSQKRTLLASTSDGAETTLAMKDFPRQLARWHAVLEWASKLQKTPVSIDLAAGFRLPVRWREVPAPASEDVGSKSTPAKHV